MKNTVKRTPSNAYRWAIEKTQQMTAIWEVLSKADRPLTAAEISEISGVEVPQEVLVAYVAAAHNNDNKNVVFPNIDTDWCPVTRHYIECDENGVPMKNAAINTVTKDVTKFLFR